MILSVNHKHSWRPIVFKVKIAYIAKNNVQMIQIYIVVHQGEIEYIAKSKVQSRGKIKMRNDLQLDKWPRLVQDKKSIGSGSSSTGCGSEFFSLCSTRRGSPLARLLDSFLSSAQYQHVF